MADQPALQNIDRRRVLRNLSAVWAAAAALPSFAGLSAEALLAAGKSIHQHVAREAAPASRTLKVFNSHQNRTVTALCELIIPQTTTPGAAAARVNEFIDIYLSSLNPSKRLEFLEGLQWIDLRSHELFKKAFVEASAEQQTELLTRLSIVNSAETATGQSFFKLIKSLTAFGYYTSKIGIEEELNFQGWVEYKGCTHPEHQG